MATTPSQQYPYFTDRHVSQQNFKNAAQINPTTEDNQPTDREDSEFKDQFESYGMYQTKMKIDKSKNAREFIEHNSKEQLHEFTMQVQKDPELDNTAVKSQTILEKYKSSYFDKNLRGVSALSAADHREFMSRDASSKMLNKTTGQSKERLEGVLNREGGASSKGEYKKSMLQLVINASSQGKSNCKLRDELSPVAGSVLSSGENAWML